jgi:hypothetical protein
VAQETLSLRAQEEDPSQECIQDQQHQEQVAESIREQVQGIRWGQR